MKILLSIFLSCYVDRKYSIQISKNIYLKAPDHEAVHRRSTGNRFTNSVEICDFSVELSVIESYFFDVPIFY